jgi:hypothetical protein
MERKMYKIALVLTLVATANLVKGQPGEKIDENIFGVLAGGTLSNITNYEADNRTGFQVGVYWEWRFSEKFSTLPNIVYSE